MAWFFKSKKDREAKDRQLNGHRFSTGACLGPTVCVVCDKPASGKDYLHCSVCTAIVHRGCKDSIPLCLKTFPNKYAVPMTRTKTASLPQNFTVRESPVQYIIPTSSILPSVTPEENKDSGAWTCSFQNTDRLNDQSESESDPNQSVELLTAPLSSSSTDFGEDCVDAYIFKDILADAADYEAESWSSSVDHKFYKKQDKKAIKRQDVIYELMQTEIHHLQTLHVMAEVFRRGVKQEVQLEEEEVQRLFPCLDQLLLLHHGFFTLLKERRQNSAQPQGQTNYLIQRIGDVLLQQFSGENGKQMTHLYGEFCSHHNEAVSFFKELQLNNKKFQNFIKLQVNNSLVRRREIPECILLVTQRITKYPVLLERILLYTQAGTDEHSDITKVVALIRGVIAAVDLKVSKYEQQQKFQEVWTRMENRSSAKLKNGHLYRKHDMMRPGQTLSHQGILLWKSATGRLKDVLALLLTDTLIFLQEKDQKFVFAAVDQKPAVISLQKLIVREVANEERGMFLISASTAGPEMYEVHAASKEERNAWMRAIREAVESCPEEEQDYTSESEEEKRATEARIQKIHKLQESLTSFDHQICCSLEEKLQIYAELTTVKNKMEDAVFEPRLLVQNQEEPPQASVLLTAALREAENLTTILLSKTCLNSSSESDVDSVFTHSENPKTLTETKKKDVNSKVSQSVQSLTRLLYSLQAAVTLQDSWYEVQKLLMSENDRSSPRTHDRAHLSNPRTLQEQEKQRNLEKRKEEAATARRLREQLRKDRDRWERECKTRESQQEALERRLEEREKQCHLEAERLMREKEELQEQLMEYQQNLERLREGQRSVERERERLIQRNQPMVTTHLVIPLDGQVPQMAQPIDPADNGSVFVNEANTSINNRLVYHRENDPSAHNCLNALLARSSSRRPPSARTHPETEHQDWGSSSFFSPAGVPDLERTAGDENTDMTWPSQTDSGGEESREETIVYL